MKSLHGLVLLFGIIAAAALAAGFSNPEVTRFIEDAGANVPTEDVVRDYALGLCWAMVLLAGIFVLPISWDNKKLFAGGWLVKSFTAMVLMLPYEEHYWGLDCWFYFRSAHQDLDGLWSAIFRGGSDLIIGLTGLLARIGPDSFHAIKLTFAFCGLVGIYLFYRAAEELLGRTAPAAFWILLLYPSILFWSSILGKDPLVLMGIGIHVWALAKLAVTRESRYLWVAVLGILLVSAVRVWMGPILMVPSVLVVLSRIRGPVWRMVALSAVTVVALGLGYATIDRFSLQDSADLVEATRTVTDGWENTNSSLETGIEINSTFDLVAFAPEGLFNTYFRPLPGDVQNAFGWMAGFENLALLGLAVWAAFRFRFAYLRNPFFFWSLTLLLTWGLAYSLVTYRDLGTAVRFKLQMLPVLLGIIGFLIQKRRAPLRRPELVPAERLA